MSRDVDGPLQLTEVGHRYGEHVVLDDINLTIERGIIAALMGPSGSGKSTLLAIVGGLISPTHGVVRRPEGGNGSVQWVHQNVNVLGRRSALDNVSLALFNDGCSRPEADLLAAQALTKVRLGELATRRVATLSGGEAQRVSIARALVGAPALVLADEPTGQLDRASSDTVMESFRVLCAADSIVLVATHDIEVAHACDRILTLRDGVLIENG